MLTDTKFKLVIMIFNLGYFQLPQGKLKGGPGYQAKDAYHFSKALAKCSEFYCHVVGCYFVFDTVVAKKGHLPRARLSRSILQGYGAQKY